MQRMVPRGIGLVVAASWLLLVGVTGAIAGRAVAVLDGGSGQAGPLSQQEVTAALAAAHAAAATPGPGPDQTLSPSPSAAATTAGPSPSATATTAGPLPTATGATPSHAPSPRPTVGPAPPTPTQVVRTWAVTGGEVAVACSGDSISLLYATPSDGWTVDVGSAGPRRVEVELTQDGKETKVSAVCAAGTPERDVQEHAED